MSNPKQQVRARIRRRLLRWYDRNRRDLPWRRAPQDAYQQLLAEIMLQQTQVDTVIPYFNKFISAYPTVQELAAAPLDDVLKLWAGLGYYARARNLHKAAKLVTDELDSRFPDNVVDLQTLPGVGRYTAGAIASIAFERRAPILDGNVKRLLSRLFAVRTSPDSPRTIERLWQLAELILPRKRCGDFNQALMELGATVCKPKLPDCPACPLETECEAKRLRMVDRLPPRTRRTRPKRQDVLVAAVQHAGRYLIRQRDHKGLWGGMWELPAVETTGRQPDDHVLRNLLNEVCPSAPGDIEISRPLPQIRHQLTHRSMRFKVYPCKSCLARLPFRSRKTLRWVRPEALERFAFATAQRKVIAAVLGVEI